MWGALAGAFSRVAASGAVKGEVGAVGRQAAFAAGHQAGANKGNPQPLAPSAQGGQFQVHAGGY